MSLNTLHDLLVDELKDLYSAENQLLKALPKMAKAATSPKLKAAFEDHLEQTEIHVARLEEICEGLDVSPKGKKCAAMAGLIEEGAGIIEAKGDPAVKDAALIAGAKATGAPVVTLLYAGRPLVLGSALDRIYRFLGYNVTTINYLGDWGTQFGFTWQTAGC